MSGSKCPLKVGLVRSKRKSYSTDSVSLDNYERITEAIFRDKIESSFHVLKHFSLVKIAGAEQDHSGMGEMGDSDEFGKSRSAVTII